MHKVHKPNDSFNGWCSSHPFHPFNIEISDTLIIGSIPPYRFCVKSKELFCGDLDWYYGSKDNYFWDIIKSACYDRNIDLCSIEKRKEFLCKNNIGILDMVSQCTRKEGGSSDKDLYNIMLIDACEIIKNNQNLKRIFFTSIFVSDLFGRQTQTKIDLKNRDIQKIKVCDKDIEVMVLYSPSPSWARGLKDIRQDPNRNEIRIEQYKKLCNKVNLK